MWGNLKHKKMKAKFYNYQNKDEDRDDLFESEIDVIPLEGSHVCFHYNNDIHISKVVSILHCFGSDSKFNHIDIELDNF